MNRINTDEMSWSEQVMVFKAVCKYYKRGCSNCPNCAHFEMREKMKITVDKEKIRYMFEMCGLEELEIVIPILKTHIDKMLKGVNDLIEEFENDKDFALDFWSETKERIEKLYFKK